MKFASSLPILLATCFPFLAAADPERTEVSILFEYQLEVNRTSVTGTTADVLEKIDSTILPTLQSNLPNGATKNGETLPNVHFSEVSSEIFSACFTKSEQCSLVRSTVVISTEGEKPDHSVEFVSLRLVQEFLKNYSILNQNVLAFYAFPSMVESLAQFKMDTVRGLMSDTDIAVLRETFVEVFGAIVFAIEGDTEVVDAKFVYQDLLEIEDRRLSPDGDSNSTATNTTTTEDDSDVEVSDTGEDHTLSTDMKITGFCRDCTSSQFGEVVNGVIVDNLVSFQDKLKLNGNTAGSAYFQNVTSISFAVPELPSKLPPIGDASIFDDQPPAVESKLPWFLFLGIALSFCILCTGFFLIYKDGAVYEKEEEDFSTSESEGDLDEETYPDGDYTNAEQTEGDGTYTELDDYQVETIAPTEEDGTANSNNYEVYVF